MQIKKKSLSAGLWEAHDAKGIFPLVIFYEGCVLLVVE